MQVASIAPSFCTESMVLSGADDYRFLGGIAGHQIRDSLNAITSYSHAILLWRHAGN